MRKTFLFTSILIFLIALTNASVNACWCRNDPEETNTEENFRETINRLVNHSDFVFTGTLIEENEDQLVFDIDKSWKGNLKDKVFFPKHFGVTGKGREQFIDSCEFYFVRGKRYLVYADATIYGFKSDKCGRTNLFDKTQRDITELNRRDLENLLFLRVRFSHSLEINFPIFSYL